jgi:hypothetical protein
MLEFRILGPLRAPDDGHEIAIKARQRGMLWMDSSRLESPRDPHVARRAPRQSSAFGGSVKAGAYS